MMKNKMPFKKNHLCAAKPRRTFRHRSRRVEFEQLVQLCLLVAAIILLYPAESYCGYSHGGAFKVPGYGGRAWGMGGAAASLGGDESAAYWNPAFLSCLENDYAGLSYVNLIAGVKAGQSYIAYARVLKDSPAGETDRKIARHAAGVIYGNLSLGLAGGGDYSENSVRLAYAYTPDYFLSLGAAASMLISRSDVPGFDSRGSNIDVGLRLQISESTSLGLVLRNAVSRLLYGDGRDYALSRSYTLALSFSPAGKLLLACDCIFSQSGLSRAVLGGEYPLLANRVFLRSAGAYLPAGGGRFIPYLGMGFRFNRFLFQYNANFDSEDAFEDTHRFSVGLEL